MFCSLCSSRCIQYIDHILRMKFGIQCIRGEGARLGQLTELGRHGNITIETPMCMLFTRAGTV